SSGVLPQHSGVVMTAIDTLRDSLEGTSGPDRTLKEALLMCLIARANPILRVTQPWASHSDGDDGHFTYPVNCAIGTSRARVFCVDRHFPLSYQMPLYERRRGSPLTILMLVPPAQ